ncbi:MAG: molybdate ABC transporter substrate-binding protein [Acidimicrobiales bacterium]
MRIRRLSVATALVLLAACSGGTSGSSGSGSITVFAASSLTDAFNEIGKGFEAANSGAQVTFNYGGSSILVQQIGAGAPADVLATADETTMQQAVTAATVAEPAMFAHNRLAILVAKGNPKGIRSLADLARPGLIVVLCAAEVPCGRFGAQALDKAGATVTPRSLEANVKGVQSKVTLGEADAGIVYVTDVQSAGDKAEGVTIPDPQNVVAAYPIAAVRASANRDLAAAFVAYVRSAAGRQVLTQAGFDP